MRAPAPLTSHGTIPPRSATQTRHSCFRAEHSPRRPPSPSRPPCATARFTDARTRAAAPASGTAGGSVWDYQGNGAAFVIGDPGDGSDTPGFYLTDLTLATANGGSSARAIDFHRVQEIDIERVYFIGNNGTGQTGITLDGTGNYSGGTFQSFHLSNFGTALLMTGNGTGAANAGTFTRMHIDCPTSGGSPITGVIGMNLAYGDGNTFVGGDIEGCDTMLSLGAGANSNTFVGVRNENSNSQVNAASGSQYNLWLTGGTMFTGKLTDAGYTIRSPTASTEARTI